MDNEILNWITKHPDIVLILEGDPYFAKEFTVEMRFHNFPERIKYRINSLMAEHIIEILDQMRKELIGAEIIEKRADCDREYTDCTVCFKESHCKALAKAERELK